MAHKKSKPARKSVSSKVFVARMREVKASKATRSHNAADKMLQNPGSQKKNNAVAVMAEVCRSTKGPSLYEALKNSPSPLCPNCFIAMKRNESHICSDSSSVPSLSFT